jgi:uncharacterized protein YdaU (DUF1376 family)
MEIGLHYYQFHINDYRGATSHLSNEEDLAYRRLIEMYYDTERPIPLDLAFVSRRIRIAPEIIAVVLRDFFQETEEGWVNKRAEKEIVLYHEKKDTASRAGKASAERRANKKPTDDERPFNDRSTTVQPTNNQEPITNNQEPIKTITRSRAVSCPLGVSTQVWDDFLEVREAKRLPVTETFIAGITREAAKAGWSLEQALAECASRGWAGFKSDWVQQSAKHGLDQSRSQDNEIVNRTIGRLRNVDVGANGANLVENEVALRRELDAEMGRIGSESLDL